MGSFTRISCGLLFILSVLCLVSANRCAGPAGSYGNFNASVRLSFTNAKHLSPTVSWWNSTALYPYAPDPQYCDNNNPNLYPASPWVCPTDNFNNTDLCPGGCSPNGACASCGVSNERGRCHGENFDCGYQSQLRWGTPTVPRNPELATNAKSGFAFYGSQNQEILCSKSIHIGDLSHLNWAVAEAAGADAELSMELYIQSLAQYPLRWTWRIAHYEAPDSPCPGVEYPDCCPEATGYCAFDGDACGVGCNDVVGFYEVPRKSWQYLVTSEYGHTDLCYYNITVWMQVTHTGLLCLPVSPDNATNPWVVAWEQTGEQKVSKIPLFIRIDQGCEATPSQTQTQTPTQTTSTTPPSTTTPPASTGGKCVNVVCNPCLSCDVATGLCSIPKVTCGECGECDTATGQCTTKMGKTCGSEKNGCMACDANGQCVLSSNRTCNLGLGENACTSGICAPTGKCIPNPNAPFQVGLPCGTNAKACEMSFCDAQGRCVAQPAPEGTSCETGDDNECAVAMCNAQGQCEETLLVDFPCKGNFLLDPKDNTTWCKRPTCVGRECVLQTLPKGANCTPPNATLCEVWQCNVKGECERNNTLTLCIPPAAGRRWVVAAGVAGGAFAIIALAALAFLFASRVPPVPSGAQGDVAMPHMANSPIYNPMGLEGSNPLYAANP